MLVTTFLQQMNPSNPPTSQRITTLCQNLGKNTKLPDETKNHSILNYPLVDELVFHKEAAITPILEVLKSTTNEKVIAEGLYTLDRMIDAGVKNIDKTYPVISKFNNTTSPTVQTLLAGIYRKTQVPDAFGPLCSMLIRDTLSPNSPYFDPKEEIGGAILEYLRNKSANTAYQSK